MRLAQRMADPLAGRAIPEARVDCLAGGAAVEGVGALAGLREVGTGEEGRGGGIDRADLPVDERLERRSCDGVQLGLAADVPADDEHRVRRSGLHFHHRERQRVQAAVGHLGHLLEQPARRRRREHARDRPPVALVARREDHAVHVRAPQAGGLERRGGGRVHELLHPNVRLAVDMARRKNRHRGAHASPSISAVIWARSVLRMIFPVVVIGSSSTKRILRGHW